MIEINIPYKKMFWYVQFIIIAVISFGILLQAANFFRGNDFVFGLVPLFDADHEASLPTWISSMLLLGCAGQLWLIARATDAGATRCFGAWKGLSALFLLASAEEIGSFHENLMVIMRKRFQQDLFYFPWVIPAIIVVLVLAALYARWFAQLPPVFRTRLFYALAVYLGGALGAEIAGGFYAEHFGTDNFSYAVVTHMEEFLEMTGANMICFSLNFYLSQMTAANSLNFSIKMKG